MRIILALIVILLLCLAAALAPSWLSRRTQTAKRQPAYQVSVKAGDVEDGRRLSFKVFTTRNGARVPIQDCGVKHSTMATLCSWRDDVPRDITVEAEGYLPREYRVTGKTNIIAMLYRMK
jgi:hypothetical protein